MPTWTMIRSQLATASLQGAPPETIDALRRDMKAARAEAYLRELVVGKPPITKTQRGELAAILTGGGPYGHPGR